MKAKAVFFLILCRLTSYAQTEDFYCTAFTSGSVAFLNIQADVNVPKKFPTGEWSIGVCFIKPLTQHLDIRSRIGYGIKFKRAKVSIFTQGTPTFIANQIYSVVDSELAKRNTDFVDVPIIVHYKIPRSNVGFEAGFNYRIYGWFSQQPFADCDYGPLANVTYTFNKFTIFCGGSLGLHKMMDMIVAYDIYNKVTEEYDPPGISSWSAKSAAVQAGIEYDLFRKTKKE